MKKWTSIILLFSGCFGMINSSYAQSIQAWKVDLLNHRDSINENFRNPETSILPEKDIVDFEILKFFAPDPDYRIKAKFKRIKKGKVFKMKTSTSRLPEYRPYGKLKFELEGKKQCLTIYQNVRLTGNAEYSDYLFLPFTDLTNGDGSYGGGRYLDMKIGDLEDPVIDFNYAYNPYCAYNDKYSCPIPPMENHLDVKINAGVMRWH